MLLFIVQVLREAKEKAEAHELEQEDHKSMRKAQYETLFDDFHGMISNSFMKSYNLLHLVNILATENISTSKFHDICYCSNH